MASLVDSVNAFTQVFVDAFDLKWLQLRHALVDVLPFAGSEILVMKERFSDRDLAQALVVITDALKRYAKESGPKKPKPLIVIDGIGEGSRRWMDSLEGKQMIQRLFRWCIHIIKERQLAHIVMTGSEQLVVLLTSQDRVTRGHVRVVGLGDLNLEDAAKIIRTELSDATDDEIKRITDVFGGFIHDIKGASRDIQYRIMRQGKKASKVGSKKRRKIVDEVMKTRFQQQVERVTASFADAKEDAVDTKSEIDGGSQDDDEMDPYLDPLKSIYSEAQAISQSSACEEIDDRGSWTELQLWRTLKRLVDSPDHAVSFSELRDEVFDGNKSPILDLMSEDILSFEVEVVTEGWFWKVTPASTALRLAFAEIVGNGALKESFDETERAEKRSEEMKSLDYELSMLHRKRKNLDLRKKSLLQTIELGKEIDRESLACRQLVQSFKDIVREEEKHDMNEKRLHDRMVSLAGTKSLAEHENPPPLQVLLKSAVHEIMSSGGSSSSSNERHLKLTKAFNALCHANNGNITAEDVVRVVEEFTGRSVSKSAAEQLVNEWDLDDDNSLDYYEFLRLLLSNDVKQKKS